jgi:hypothetical protein
MITLNNVQDQAIASQEKVSYVCELCEGSHGQNFLCQMPTCHREVTVWASYQNNIHKMSLA